MNKLGMASLVLPSLLLCTSCLHAEMAVSFLPPTPPLAASQAQQTKIKEAVFRQFKLDDPDSPYNNVRIQVRSVSVDSETEVQVVLFYKDKYLADIYYLTLDKAFGVIKSIKE
jgi:hypothetical protein